jgi:hypothetical protein
MIAGSTPVYFRVIATMSSSHAAQLATGGQLQDWDLATVESKISNNPVAIDFRQNNDNGLK